MSLILDLAVVVGCYGIGCLSPGYWLVRWRTGHDLRDRHSGSTGARNVGRMLGPGGFAATFLLDLAKGALAVSLARALGLAGWALALAGLAVVVGHVWPVQLRFRGGRGLSPGLGAALVLHPPTALGVLLVAAAVLVATRLVNEAGVVAAVSAPFIAALTGAPWPSVAGFAAMAAVILVAHRGRPRAMIERFVPAAADRLGPAGRGDDAERVGPTEAPGGAPKGPTR